MVHYHNMAISSCTAKFCGVMQPQAPKPPDCGDIVYTPARPHPHTTHSNAPKIAPSPCRFSARSFSIFRKIQKLRFRVRIVGSLQPFIWPAQICKPLSWAEECPWWWMGVTPQSLHGFVRIAWIMNHAMIWIRIIVDHNLNSVFRAYKNMVSHPSDNNITPEGVKALVQSLVENTSLQDLDLGCMPHSCLQCEAISISFQPKP